MNLFLIIFYLITFFIIVSFIIYSISDNSMTIEECIKERRKLNSRINWDFVRKTLEEEKN